MEFPTPQFQHYKKTNTAAGNDPTTNKSGGSWEATTKSNNLLTESMAAEGGDDDPGDHEGTHPRVPPPPPEEEGMGDDPAISTVTGTVPGGLEEETLSWSSSLPSLSPDHPLFVASSSATTTTSPAAPPPSWSPPPTAPSSTATTSVMRQTRVESRKSGPNQGGNTKAIMGPTREEKKLDEQQQQQQRRHHQEDEEGDDDDDGYENTLDLLDDTVESSLLRYQQQQELEQHQALLLEQSYLQQEEEPQTQIPLEALVQLEEINHDKDQHEESYLLPPEPPILPTSLSWTHSTPHEQQQQQQQQPWMMKRNHTMEMDPRVRSMWDAVRERPPWQSYATGIFPSASPCPPIDLAATPLSEDFVTSSDATKKVAPSDQWAPASRSEPVRERSEIDRRHYHHHMLDRHDDVFPHDSSKARPPYRLEGSTLQDPHHPLGDKSAAGVEAMFLQAVKADSSEDYSARRRESPVDDRSFSHLPPTSSSTLPTETPDGSSSSTAATAPAASASFPYSWAPGQSLGWSQPPSAIRDVLQAQLETAFQSLLVRTRTLAGLGGPPSPIREETEEEVAEAVVDTATSQTTTAAAKPATSPSATSNNNNNRSIPLPFVRRQQVGTASAAYRPFANLADSWVPSPLRGNNNAAVPTPPEALANQHHHHHHRQPSIILEENPVTVEDDEDAKVNVYNHRASQLQSRSTTDLQILINSERNQSQDTSGDSATNLVAAAMSTSATVVASPFATSEPSLSTSNNGGETISRMRRSSSMSNVGNMVDPESNKIRPPEVVSLGAPDLVSSLAPKKISPKSCTAGDFSPIWTLARWHEPLSRRFLSKYYEPFSAATWIGFWAMLHITCANYVLSPMRDAIALQVGVEHMPKLTLASTVLAFCSSVPIGWLFEAPDPNRRKMFKRMGLTRGETQGTSLALFYRVFAMFLVSYAVGFTLIDRLNKSAAFSDWVLSIRIVPAALEQMRDWWWPDVRSLWTASVRMLYVAFFLVVHLMKLHSLSLVWGVITEAMEYEEVARNRSVVTSSTTRLQRLSLVSFGGTVGGIMGSAVTSSLAQLLRLPGLLIVSTILLEISAQLSIELGRIMQKYWVEQQKFQSTNDLASLDTSMKRSASWGSMKRVASGNSLNRVKSASDLSGGSTGLSSSASNSSPLSSSSSSSHAESTAPAVADDNTFTQRLLRGVTTILRSRLLMAIFTYNALYASTNVLLSFQRADLVAKRNKATTVQADTAFLANINMASSIAIFALQATGVGATVADLCGPRGTLALMPLIRLAGVLSLAWWHSTSGGRPPNLLVFLVVDECCKVMNLAVAKPVRESLWGGLSNEARYEAKPIVDTLANRWGGGSAAFLVHFIEGTLDLMGVPRNGHGDRTLLGFPPLLALCLIIAAWWAAVSLDLGHIRRRIDQELKKRM